MERILYCFLLSAATPVICLVIGYGIARYNIGQEQVVPNTVAEAETVNDVNDKATVNQREIEPVLESIFPAEEYYLVSESGFLLMFYNDGSAICLYTHIPVTDFSEMERAELMGGVWLSSMMDVYHYLESYTS